MYCLKLIQNKMRRVSKREGRKEKGREGEEERTRGPFKDQMFPHSHLKQGRSETEYNMARKERKPDAINKHCSIT